MTLNRTNLFAATLLIIGIAGCASKPVQTERKYSFWPPYPDDPRLQYLCSFSSSASVEPTKSKPDELVYGKEIEQVQELVKPYGVDVWNGRVYVCDLRSAAVTVLDLRKQQTLLIGRSGSDTLQTPTDIAIAPEGTKYVADLGKGRVYVFDPNDRQVGSFGDGQSWRPVGVAVFQDELYVCDFQQQCVHVLDRRSGAPLRKIGSPGQGPGQFVRPLGIAVDGSGYLYVADVLNCRLQKFDRQGQLVTGFGMISANVGGMVRPKHIDVDREGTIYVVDAAFQNVQLFDQIGRVFTFFGSAGTHPGSMYLPAGINVHEGDLDLFEKYLHPAFQAERLIFVTNQFGENKVAVYAFGHLKEGKTAKDIETSSTELPAATAEPGSGVPGPATLPTAPLPDIPDDAPPPAPAAPATTPLRTASNANTGRK